jgi:hypothetical protein
MIGLRRPPSLPLPSLFSGFFVNKMEFLTGLGVFIAEKPCYRPLGGRQLGPQCYRPLDGRQPGGPLRTRTSQVFLFTRRSLLSRRRKKKKKNWATAPWLGGTLLPPNQRSVSPRQPGTAQPAVGRPLFLQILFLEYYFCKKRFWKYYFCKKFSSSTPTHRRQGYR